MRQTFIKYLNNQCSPEEVVGLLNLFNNPANESELRNLILENLGREAVSSGELKQWQQVADRSYASIKMQMDGNDPISLPLLDESKEKAGNEPAKVIELRSGRRWWYAAAAVLVMLGTFSLYRFNFKKAGSPVVAGLTVPKNDIGPGGNKAILTLANGSTIVLDSAVNGNVASQGNTKIIKLNGQLAYSAVGNSSEIVYNTITTPRGGQYELILADGSQVWLNAASSLRYPVNFTGNERKVSLTGEGYFEVAKNAAMPFKVDVAGKGEVEVLGTHFNINAYADEPDINTTLLEGRVRLTQFSNKNSVILAPGQQGILHPNGEINIDKNVDIDEVMAWKNGLFSFNSVDIESIMRQLGRWYDVEVSFEGTVSKDTYSAIVSRNNNLSKVLKVLETGGVKYKINGNKVIIQK